MMQEPIVNIKNGWPFKRMMLDHTRQFIKGMVVMLSILGTVRPENASAATKHCKPLIIDHDGGLDDYVALLYMLNDANYCIKAVTTVTGIAEVERGVLGSVRILSKLNRKNILVGQGVKKQPHTFPEFIKKVENSLPDFKSLKPTAAEQKKETLQLAKIPNAQNLLETTLKASKTPVTLLAIGPLTNIARYFRKHPNHLKKVERIVVMGGALRVDGNSHSQPPKVSDISSEYNFFIDPESAAYVLDLPVPIQIVPLDATNYAFLRPAYIDRVHKEPFDAARIAADMLESARQFLEIEPGLAIYDGLAALALSHPDLMTWKDMRIEVSVAEPASGRTRPLTCSETCTKKRNIKVAIASWRTAIYDALTNGLRYNAK